MALVFLLAPEASAQMLPGQPVRTVPTQPEIAAQATFDTSYLLALYMAQLANAGTPPSQADIDEAARQYFTNGAAAVSVPTSGPGAAYFRNGAEVMAYPTAPAAPAPATTVETSAAGGESYEEDAGVAPANAESAAPAGITPAQSAPAPEVVVGPYAATGLTCPPGEIEAALAIATQFATTVAPAPPAASCPPSGASTFVPPRIEPSPATAVEPAPSCPTGPSVASRIAPALGGALLGALAVVLWSRPRPVRVTRARNAR
jgi:hypothetical protein